MSTRKTKTFTSVFSIWLFSKGIGNIVIIYQPPNGHCTPIKLHSLHTDKLMGLEKSRYMLGYIQTSLWSPSVLASPPLGLPL